MSARMVSAARFAAMAAVTLVVGHNLVFLAGYGARYGDALALTGHDHGWTAAVALVLGVGVVTFVMGAWQLRRLGVVAHSSPARTADRVASGPGLGILARRWLWLSLRLALVAAVLFVLQESAEHVAIGEAPPGLSALASAQYPNTIPIIFGVATAIGFVGALFGWRRDILIARIRAARRVRHSPAAPRRKPLRADVALGSVLGRRRATRAPPLRLDPA